ncbi:outer membrane beta-barrel protein [Tamlana agarivorans]|uniref:Outer membrane beta-barrel protein n=1 Tax=Pseudotamlana agarivorans TaxID=481183 RepID=A0ACC5UCL6_9FLAO|nr:outer membrane beta-barrel protein [Tamlana agarivorans]MBU2952086.1 outer membrane beta-barrel protein [Tamlana agarivorans]
MKVLLSALLLVVSTSLFAQKFTLEGIIKDNQNLTLEAATVFIQSTQDSLILAYGITNNDGKFSIRVNAEEAPKVLLNVAYLGYEPYSQFVEVPESKDLDVGILTLKDAVESLNTVSIIARSPPVVIKKDTIEYNADSFKTLPNDRAEDLLKKLPGVEIDIDGLITVNGVEVEAINVDGMRFFGEKNGDIALKNLPSNVISKVQVTDYKSDMQKFTGEESDSGTKEINFKIKKGKNRAFFGDFNAGYGTDDKYQVNANLFQLVDGKQIGVISGSNNINMKRGFNALPDARSSNGYIESDFIGANYTKGKWDETRVNGNYQFDANNTDNAQKRVRENFLPNLNYISETESASTNDVDTHTAGLDINYIIKPKNKLTKRKVQLSNDLKFNSSASDNFSNSSTVSKSMDDDLISEVNANNESTSTQNRIENEFGVITRTGKGSDFFNINVNTSYNSNNSESSNYSENILYDKNETRVQDQIRSSDKDDMNVNLNAYWFKELFPNFKAIPSYTARISYNQNEMLIYDLDSITNDYTDFNKLQSADSKYATTTVVPALRLRYEYKDFRFEIEGAYTNTFSNYTDQLIDARNFDTEFEYFNYSGRIRYRDKNGYKNISLRYNQSVNLPSATQLQPVVDESNQTHIKIGNPLLEPQVNHNLSFQYQNNLAFNNINITGRAGAQFYENKIINATLTDTDLIKYTTYKNINGSYAVHGDAAISKSFYSKKTNFNINMRLSGRYSNNLSIQNDVQFTAKNSQLKPTLALRYSYDSKVDLSASYSYSMNKNIYDTDTFADNAFFLQNLNFEASIFFLKNFFFSNKISYQYNSRVGDEFDGDAVLWNAGLGVQLWNEKATLTLIGYDMLDMNNGFRRSVSETYIQDVENLILEQYFMATFVYKFGRIAGKNMNVPSGHRERGGRSGGSGGRGRGRN